MSAYKDVRRRHAAGVPLARIARVLGLALGTTRRFAAATTTFPERVGYPKRPFTTPPTGERAQSADVARTFTI